MAGIVTLVLVAQYLIYRNFGLKNIEYRLTISTPEAFENDEIEVIEEIENNKWLPLPWIRTEISCSRWLCFYGKSQNVAKDAQKGFVAGVFMLKGHRKLKRTWRVRLEKRGVFRIEDVTLAVSDLFGLCKPAAMFKLSEEITVLPSPSEMEVDGLSTEEFMGNNAVYRFILPDPFVISGAKEYTGREPMNRIHWQKTASTGELMVYNNEFTTERTMLVVLNMQRIIADETIPLSTSLLEAEIKSAAFVLDYCYQNDIAVGFAINAEESVIIPPDRSYEFTLNILRRLARLKNRCGCHIDDFLPKLDTTGITDIVLISDIMTDVSAEFLGSLQRNGRNVVLIANTINETGFCHVCHLPKTRNYPNESGEDT